MATRTALVTGATGYVGGRLVRELLEAGFKVRILARRPEKVLDSPWADKVTVIQGNAHSREDLKRAMEGSELAYFLVHSLQQGAALEQSESELALEFAESARATGVGRIIYLGGLAPQIPEESMSPHMRSRVRVGQILAGSGIPTIEFRASVIIGSGSASFEMLRYLTERLPAMVTPRWVHTRTQPIAIRDVLRYLVLAADIPLDVSRVFEIGGPEVLSYEEMMQRYAAAAGLRKRIILPINVLTPELSSHWVSVVTPVPRAIARPLVQSLRHPAVCREHDVAQWIPDPPGGLVPFEESVRLALARIREASVETRWSDSSFPGAPSEPLPSDPVWTGGSLYTDLRELPCRASADELWASVERIGGEAGWYSARLLWEVRGVMDRLAGGAGLQRGRRDPKTLAIGDAVDFWRVEERQAPRLLRLRAEMKMPGRAWLEFTVSSVDDGTSVLHQRAIYWPRSFVGHAYWWAVAPFHAFVFPPMARHIVEFAESRQVTRAITQLDQ